MIRYKNITTMKIKLSRRFFVPFLLLFILLVSFDVANSLGEADVSSLSAGEMSANPQKAPTFQSIVQDLKNKNWMYLSQEQRLEDFNFLYKELKANYPYFGVAKRKAGVDIDASYELTKEMIKNCDNDYDYFNILQKFCNDIHVGHLSLWGRRYRSEVQNYKDFIIEFPEYEQQLKPYIEILDNPLSQENYEKMEAFFAPVIKTINEYYENLEQKNESEGENEPKQEFANVTTQIIEEGKIAYVNIATFDMAYYNESKEILFDFYKQITDYDNLIIDISQNSGGGMSYFNDLIVAPNIDKSLSVTTYNLIKAGENNKRHLNLDEQIQAGLWKQMDQLPSLPNIIQEDLKEMDYFSQDDIIIEPLNSKKIFKGKIWLLVSGNVYSSSEHAAMFSKSSGFATLVGTQTGGDGIGTDPVHIILPNSGLVVQHSPIYGITSDGAGSEEFGTTPDVISAEGESPLNTCIRVIEGEKNQR